MPSKTYDVIIIGGGLSGLAASAHLTKLGYQVCLLEARNRLGGRLYGQVMGGQSFELGASYLQSQGPNPMLGLFQHYKIQTSALEPLNSDCFTIDGKHISLAEWQQSLNYQFEKANRLIQEAKLSSKATKPSLATVLGYGSQIPPKSSKEFRARQIITNTILRNTGARPDEVSLLELMQDETFVGNDDALVVNGTHKLSEGLQQESEATQNFTLFLKSNVQSIRHEKQHSALQVETETGEEYQAEVVLCAVPLGLLKRNHIRFSPTLTKEKQKAIRHINLGEQNHIMLEFNKAFWPETAHYLYPNDSDVNQWP